MFINAIAVLRLASPWQRTGLSPLEVPLYKLKFGVVYLLPALRRESSMEECRKTSGIQVPDEPLELSAIGHSMG